MYLVSLFSMIFLKSPLNRESLPICTLGNIILFLQDFLQSHCVSTHYSFQIMKCVGEDPCAYCTMNPPRLPDDVLDGFSFLPCPVPDDSGDHFKTFQEVHKLFDNVFHLRSYSNFM